MEDIIMEVILSKYYAKVLSTKKYRRYNYCSNIIEVKWKDNINKVVSKISIIEVILS